MNECDDSIKVAYGCQLEGSTGHHCKSHGQEMSLKELRIHLTEECNKITMQCNICGEQMRRPWMPYHECVRVYRCRLDDKNDVIH